MIAASRLYMTAAILGAAAVAALLAAFLRRDSIIDVLGIEGAYLERNVGDPPFIAAFGDEDTIFKTGNVFDPFSIGNAYLWLGVGCAFAIAALALLLVARLGRGA